MNKPELIKGLVIILDLSRKDAKELQKMEKGTLIRIYEGQKKNAIAYQEMSRTYANITNSFV